MCSLPALNEAAGRSGFLNAAPDADGILRRVPVLMEVDGQIYPSLALATVAAVAKTDNAVLQRGQHQRVGSAHRRARHSARRARQPAGALSRREAHVSLSVGGRRDAGPRARRTRWPDKIVFLGTTALGTREVVATPLDTLFAGVEVQATVADNLLQGDFAGRPVHAAAIETEVVIALRAAGGGVRGSRRPDLGRPPE